jgi:hypothetical protein
MTVVRVGLISCKYWPQQEHVVSDKMSGGDGCMEEVESEHSAMVVYDKTSSVVSGSMVSDNDVVSGSDCTRVGKFCTQHQCKMTLRLVFI